MAQKPKVLISGVSEGIGAGSAAQFAARGHDLVRVARNARKLEQTAARLRAEAGGAVDISAAKAFILSLSQVLQAEPEPKGVYVQTVLPAATRTTIRDFADLRNLPPMMEVPP